MVPVVCWFTPASLVTAYPMPLSINSPALRRYILVESALDEYLEAVASNSVSRNEKADATFHELSRLADTLQSRIPRYLHQSLPYAVYLTSDSHIRTMNNQHAPKRPNTPTEIRNTTETWMCTHLVDQIASLVDRLYALQFLHSPEYDDNHLDDVERDLLNYFATIFQHTRLDILMTTDEPALYL